MPKSWCQGTLVIITHIWASISLINCQSVFIITFITIFRQQFQVPFKFVPVFQSYRIVAYKKNRFSFIIIIIIIWHSHICITWRMFIHIQQEEEEHQARNIPFQSDTEQRIFDNNKCCRINITINIMCLW